MWVSTTHQAKKPRSPSNSARRFITLTNRSIPWKASSDLEESLHVTTIGVQPDKCLGSREHFGPFRKNCRGRRRKKTHLERCRRFRAPRTIPCSLCTAPERTEAAESDIRCILPATMRLIRLGQLPCRNG